MAEEYPRPDERLSLVLKGVQRMADGLGAVEQRLPELATAERLKALSDRVDEYRVRTRAELTQLGERLDRVESDLARSTEVVNAVGHAVDVALREQAGGADPAVLGRLTEAVRGLRDDLAESHVQLRAETATAIQQVAGEQAERIVRIQEALTAVREDTLTAVASVRAELLAELLAELGSRQPPEAAPPVVVAEPVDQSVVLDRLSALEVAIGALRRDVTGDLELVAQRDDLRRGVERVIGAVGSTEQALTGEVRTLDARVGAMADDVRLVRVLRDGLDALADGVDGVRQLAARTATSQQMGEVTRELGAVLAEIDAARTQVLSVERSPEPTSAQVIEVSGEVDQLGRRIEQLAEVIEDRLASAPPATGGDAVEQLAQRLRQVSQSARQLGNGMLEDVRVRRGRRR